MTTEPSSGDPTGLAGPAATPGGPAGAATSSPMRAVAARTRWLVAGGAVVAAVAIVAVAVAVLGSRPTPVALTYIPQDSDVVFELRPDLPGDQLERVGNLLAHFPGFQDKSNLAQKLDETLKRITASASNGSVDYATQVKPWLAGPIFAGGTSASVVAGGDPKVALAFTTDGTVTCDPIVQSSTTTETYRGLVIHTAGSGAEGACALDGRIAVVGSLSGVKAAIDAHADHGSIDGSAIYQRARSRLAGDQLATMYVASRQMTAGMLSGLSSFLPSMGPNESALAHALPEWAIVGLRAEDNALVMDMATPAFDTNMAAIYSLLNQPGASPVAVPSFLTPPPAHVSTVATIVPKDTAVLYDLRGSSVLIHNLVASLSAMSGSAGSGSPFGQLDAVLGALGGVDGLTGWIGDAGIVVLSDGTTADGGVVLMALDQATATAKASQIRGWLTLAGQGLATTTDTTIDGTTVTVFDFGDASSLLGLLGPTAGQVSIPPGTRVVISVAAHGSAVIVGSGETFSRQIIETASGDSLADQPAYRTAIGLASASNAGQLYVAVPPLLGLAEQAIPDAERARYDSDVKPYLGPFDALVETATMDGNGLDIRLVLTVK